MAEIVLSQYFILTEVALTVTFVNTDMVGWVFQCFFFVSPRRVLCPRPPPRLPPLSVYLHRGRHYFSADVFSKNRSGVVYLDSQTGAVANRAEQRSALNQ